MDDKGTLTQLEQLKAEHRERFKAEAPRIKRIDLMCFRLRCSTALNPTRLKSTWRGLRVARGTCTRKTCPRTVLERYLEVLGRTRAFRQQNDDVDSRDFWRGVAGEWKEKLRKMLHVEEA